MRARLQHSPAYFVRAGAAGFLAVLFSPLVVAAQQPEPQPLSPVQVEAKRASEQIRLADQIDAQAEALYGTPRRFFEAGVLHRRAALLRGNDSTAVSSFRSAAWMFSAAGEHSHGRAMMERAAESAAGVGDVEKAANCYIDAALLAVASGREEKVPALLGRMHAVLTSPLLPPDRRAGILQRVGESATLATMSAGVRQVP